MIFDLLKDFTDVLDAMPKQHRRYRILKLLDEAIRRDVHFIDRHPTTFFQCMWNTCWWYDCPEAAKHYLEPEGGWTENGPPWSRDGAKLCVLLDRWKNEKLLYTPDFPWLRSLRPPEVPLGCGQAAVLAGHTQNVMSVACRPDGGLVATGSGDRMICLWTSPEGKLVQRLRGHDGTVTALLWAPAGDRIASGSSDKTVRIWDAETGGCLQTFEADCFRVAWSVDSSRLAVVGPGGVTVWDAIGGTLLHNFQWLDRAARITAVAWSADAQEVLYGTNRGHVCRYHLETESIQALPSPADGMIWYLERLAEGSMVAIGSQGDDKLIWNLFSREPPRRLEIPAGRLLHRFAVTPDGRIVAGAALNGGVCVWRLDVGPEAELIGRPNESILDVALSADGKRVACGVGSQDDIARIWSTGGDPLPKLHGHDDTVCCLCWTPDGAYFFSGGFDRTVRQWDGRDATDLGIFLRLEGALRFIEVTPDNAKLVTQEVKDHWDWVWDMQTRKNPKMIKGKDRLGHRRRTPVGDYDIDVNHTDRFRETEVFRLKPRTSVAWFPIPLTAGVPGEHPAGRCWACPHDEHVLVLGLEGLTSPADI